jgi:predicted enzyme related to lactoylglutathione lyase
MPQHLFRKIDCIEVPVSDLDEGLVFYRDRLGHDLIWRTETSAGLRMPGSDAEIVIQTERPDLNVDFLVSSADEAAATFREAGGRIVFGPFDIPIGRCCVVEDPWGNRLVLLDTSKGLLVTDSSGVVLRDSDGNPIVKPHA